MATQDKLIGGDLVQLLVAVVTAAGAINWALEDIAGTDLLVDVAGLAESELTLAYATIAVAAVVLLYNEFVWKGYIDG